MGCVGCATLQSHICSWLIATGTHPAAGHFTDLESWKKSALGTINKVLERPLQLQVRNVCGGGDQDWACVELMAESVAKNGMDYKQRYSWVMRFDEHGTIVQVRPRGCARVT